MYIIVLEANNGFKSQICANPDTQEKIIANKSEARILRDRLAKQYPSNTYNIYSLSGVPK